MNLSSSGVQLICLLQIFFYLLERFWALTFLISAEADKEKLKSVGLLQGDKNGNQGLADSMQPFPWNKKNGQASCSCLQANPAHWQYRALTSVQF